MATVMEKIAEELNKAENIAILPHIAADGDALGSSFALALALAGTGKKVKVFLEEEVAQVYSFLPGQELSEVFNGTAEKYDTVVALDCGDLERLGRRAEIFNGARITVNIDHHSLNSEFAFHNFVDESSSAVGEIIFHLIKMMSLEMNKDIAACIYVAIATDTGGFRYSNTTSLTHKIASELLNYDVDVAWISHRVFNSMSLGKVRLTGIAINSLQILENGKVAFITIYEDDIKKAGASDEDCEGLVNIARNINNVEVAALFRPHKNGEVKVNLRSSEYVDVAAIAGMNKGGGHKRAAGYISKGSVEDVKEKLLKELQNVIYLRK